MLTVPGVQPRLVQRRRTYGSYGPVDWGIGMTVCVAAICEESKTIVTASDRLLSWGHTSSDTVLKLVRIHHPYWIAMIAGNDITHMEEVTLTARQALEVRLNTPPSVSDVMAVLRAAWRDVQNQVGAAAVLNPFKMDVPAFVKDGLKKFGESKFLAPSPRFLRISLSDLLMRRASR